MATEKSVQNSNVDIITFLTQGSYLFENTTIQFNYNMNVLTCVWSAVVPYLRVI